MKGFRLMLVLLLGLSGCATLFSDGRQKITVTSRPEGAEILLDGLPVGRTPMNVILERETFNHHFIGFNLDEVSDFEGYQSDFLKLFGFGLPGVDYEADVDQEVGFED